MPRQQLGAKHISTKHSLSRRALLWSFAGCLLLGMAPSSNCFVPRYQSCRIHMPQHYTYTTHQKLKQPPRQVSHTTIWLAVDGGILSSFTSSIIPHDVQLALSDPKTNILQTYGTLLRIYPLTTKSVTAAILAFLGDAIAQYSTWFRERQADQAASLDTIQQSKRQYHEPNHPSVGEATASASASPHTSILSIYDWSRGARFFLFGALYTGAFQHLWFSYLSSHVIQWGELMGMWGPERVELPVEPMVVDNPYWWTYFDIVAQLESTPSPAVLAAAKVAINQFGMVPLVYMPLFFWVTGNFNVEQAMARAKLLYGKLLMRNYVYWLPVQFCQFFWLPPEWQIPFLSAASLVWTVILSSIGSSVPEPKESAFSSSPALSPPWVPETLMTVATPGTSTPFFLEVLSITSVSSSSPPSLSSSVAPLPPLVDSEKESMTGTRDITEKVTLQDVRQAFLPAPLADIITNDRVGAAAAGLTMGLIASATDDAALGEVVSELFNSETVGTGVAAIAAMGAGIFVVGAVQDNEANKASSSSDNPEQKSALATHTGDVDLHHSEKNDGRVCNEINTTSLINCVGVGERSLQSSEGRESSMHDQNWRNNETSSSPMIDVLESRASTDNSTVEVREKTRS